MQVTVYHDSSGNIVATVARSDDAPSGSMATRSGLRSIDVQDDTLTADLEGSEILQRLSQLQEGQQVEVAESRGRLVERKK
jgi:hypothetical protein